MEDRVSKTDSQSLVSDDSLGNLNNDVVVIDCGHTPIGLDAGKIIFGRGGESSLSEKHSLSIGVDLYHRLKQKGKKPKISICFTDTTRFFNDPALRPDVKMKCENGEIYSLLPTDYQELLSDIPKIDCIFSLQTVNSNKFSKLIKKVKKDIRAINSSQEIYNKYNVLFVRDHLDKLFSFTNGFLLDTGHEEKILGGNWWLDEFSTLHPLDYLKAPIAPLKKFGVINLYSRTTGILCPATYGGLVLNFGDNVDHIAVYSRQDDPAIGEKIIRGIISATVLSQPKYLDKSFLQVIIGIPISNSISNYTEISLVKTADLNQKILSYEMSNKIFKERLSYRYNTFI